MRYRALDANGDYSFGQGSANFLVNSPAAVAQAVLTRLDLFQGEWFLDTTEGTPYGAQVLGEHTRATYDAAIRSRILGTQGVTGITSYASSVSGRDLTVTATIATAYGEVAISTSLSASDGGRLDFSIAGNPLKVVVIG